MSGLKLYDRTSTASLRSSIYEHVEENGRTYHRYKQGSKYHFIHHATHYPNSTAQTVEYMLPNDEVSTGAGHIAGPPLLSDSASDV